MADSDIRTTISAAIEAGDAHGAARLLSAAWDREPSAALAGFICSRFDALRPKLDLLSYRWAILRSFTVEPVVPILRACAYARGIALDVHIGEFNAYPQEILDGESALYRFRPDAVVLAVQTRDLGDMASALARFEGWIAAFRRRK